MRQSFGADIKPTRESVRSRRKINYADAEAFADISDDEDQDAGAKSDEERKQKQKNAVAAFDDTSELDDEVEKVLAHRCDARPFSSCCPCCRSVEVRRARCLLSLSHRDRYVAARPKSELQRVSSRELDVLSSGNRAPMRAVASDTVPGVRVCSDVSELEFLPEDPYANKEFYVKWRHWSHIHCSWDTRDTLFQLAGFKRVKNYIKRMEDLDRRRRVLSREEIELIDVERQMEYELSLLAPGGACRCVCQCRLAACSRLSLRILVGACALCCFRYHADVAGQVSRSSMVTSV